MNQEEFQEWVKLNFSAIFSLIETLDETARENNAAIAALKEEVRVLQMKIDDSPGSYWFGKATEQDAKIHDLDNRLSALIQSAGYTQRHNEGQAMLHWTAIATANKRADKLEEKVRGIGERADGMQEELIILTTALDELRATTLDEARDVRCIIEAVETESRQRTDVLREETRELRGGLTLLSGRTKPPHRRLINEKGEFRDVTGMTCVFRRPRQLPGVGELYIGSYNGGITLNYALIEELVPALQQFLDTGAFPWESLNSQEARRGA